MKRARRVSKEFDAKESKRVPMRVPIRVSMRVLIRFTDSGFDTGSTCGFAEGLEGEGEL